MYKIKMHENYKKDLVKYKILNNNQAVLYSIKLINKYGKYGNILLKEIYKDMYGNSGPNTYDAPIFLDYQNKLKNFGGLYKYDILNARYRLIKYINQITNILNLEDVYKNGGQLEWELN